MTSAAAAWSDGNRRGRIAGGVLAGGASRRMGGAPKALLGWPPGSTGNTFLDTVLLRLADCGIAPVGVVTGAHHDEISGRRTAGPTAAVLFNERHAEGQVTSLWRLLDWIEAHPTCPEWLAVTLVDVPGFRAATLAGLCDTALACNRQILVVRPARGDRHGHPVLWRREAWPRLRAATLEAGAKAIVHELVAEGYVLDVPTDDEGVFRDIDTPEQYRQAADDL